MAGNTTKYYLTESTVYVEDYGDITTYGVKADDGINKVIIKDISTILEDVKEFVKICNNNDVPLLVLEDVLEDYIS